MSLADPESHADPKFRTPFAHTRITAKALRKELIESRGYAEEELPCENTIGNIPNRLDYRLKRIRKTKPAKKNSETDMIFGNIGEANRCAGNTEVPGIPTDTKSKVKIG